MAKHIFKLIKERSARIDINPLFITIVISISAFGFVFSFCGITKYTFLYHNIWFDRLYQILDPLVVFGLSGFITFLMLSSLFIDENRRWFRFLKMWSIAGLLSIITMVPVYLIEITVLKPFLFGYDRPQTQFEHQLAYSIFFYDAKYDKKVKVKSGSVICPIARAAIDYHDNRRGDLFSPKNFISDYGNAELLNKYNRILIRKGLYDVYIPIVENINILNRIYTWKNKGITTLFAYKLDQDKLGECDNKGSCPSGYIMRQILILFIALLLIQKGNRNQIRILSNTWIAIGFLVFNILAFSAVFFSRWYGYQHTIYDMLISLTTMLVFLIIAFLIIGVATKKHRERLHKELESETKKLKETKDELGKRLGTLTNLEKYIVDLEMLSGQDTTELISGKKGTKIIEEWVRNPEILAELLTGRINKAKNIERIRVYLYRTIPTRQGSETVDFKYLTGFYYYDCKENMDDNFLGYSIELYPKAGPLEEFILDKITRMETGNKVLAEEDLLNVDVELLGFCADMKVYYFPLISPEGKPFGLISIDNAYTNTMINAQDIEDLNTLIKHATNHFNILKQMGTLQGLRDIYSTLASGSDINQTINAVARKLCIYLDAECVSILIKNQKTGRLELNENWSYCEFAREAPPEEDIGGAGNVNSAWFKGAKGKREGVELGDRVLTWDIFAEGEPIISNNLIGDWGDVINPRLIGLWNRFIPSVSQNEGNGGVDTIKHIMFFPLVVEENGPSVESEKMERYKGIIRIYNKKSPFYRKGEFEISDLGFSKEDLSLTKLLTYPLLLAIAKEESVEKSIDYLNRITHNIQSPVSLIISLADMMADRFDAVGGEVQSFDKDLYDLLYAAEYLNSVAEISRISSSKLKSYNYGDIQSSSTDINEVLLDRVNMIESYYNTIGNRNDKWGIVKIETNLIDGNTLVSGPDELYKDLVFIYLDNAILYTPPPERVVYVSNGITDSSIYIVIEDEGIGIPERDMAKIRQLYRSEKAINMNPDGMGLGLYVADLIAHLLDIRIDISSKEGYGTTVRIDISKGEDNG